jgi:hypothetical protein
VGEPQDPPAVTGELDAHALADVAETVQGVLGEQSHVPGVMSRHRSES